MVFLKKKPITLWLLVVCCLEFSRVKKISQVGWKVLPRKQSENEPYITS